jgi:hypothetical protein
LMITSWSLCDTAQPSTRYCGVISSSRTAANWGMEGGHRPVWVSSGAFCCICQNALAAILECFKR